MHAYVLATNHIHLLLTPEKADSASLLMKHLARLRAIRELRLPAQRNAVGRAIPFLPDPERGLRTGLLLLHRTQPVRARMVRHPSDYGWSSYAANAERMPSRIIRPPDQYPRLGRSDMLRRGAYRDLFKSQLDGETLGQFRDATNGNFALGCKRFRKDIESALGDAPRPSGGTAAGKTRKLARGNWDCSWLSTRRTWSVHDYPQRDSD